MIALMLTYFLTSLSVTTPSNTAADGGAGVNNTNQPLLDGGIQQQPIQQRPKSDPPGAMPTKRLFKRTQDPKAVIIEGLHTVIERKGDLRVTVTQVFTFATQETVFERNKGYKIQLPQGAIAPRTPRDQKGIEVKINKNAVVLKSAISPQPIDLTVAFDLLIQDKQVVIKQKLPAAVKRAQVVSTQTLGNATLVAKGFSKAQQSELQSGLIALVAMGTNLDAKKLHITVGGFDHNANVLLRQVAFFMSAFLILLGLGLWLRYKLTKAANPQTTGNTP